MFRRPGKNPFDEDHSLFTEEQKAYNKYVQQQPEATVRQELSNRIFEPQADNVVPNLFNERRTTSYTPDKHSTTSHPLQRMVSEDPETTLGIGVTFRGELSFERFLRIDGTFEGELLSNGKVTVGATGVVKADLALKEAIIEGRVVGNIIVQERLELRGDAVVEGNIEAKFLSVEEGVKIKGHVHILGQEEVKQSP